MKRATLAVLAILALGPSTKADTLDTFFVPTAIGGFPATFTLPSTVMPTDEGGGLLVISDIPVFIDGTTIDFTMQFLPLDFPGPDAGNVLMNCTTEGFIFCTFSPTIGSTFPFDNAGPFYTLSNGQMTFIPGVYDLVTITATPEPGTLLLMSAGLVGLGLWKRRVQSCS